MALEMCNHTNTEPELKAVNRKKNKSKPRSTLKEIAKNTSNKSLILAPVFW